MKQNIYLLIASILLICFKSNISLAEGTKQVTPTSSANNIDLQINRSSNG